MAESIKANEEIIHATAQTLMKEKESFDVLLSRFEESLSELSSAWLGAAGTNFSTTAHTVGDNFETVTNGVWSFSKKIGYANDLFQSVDSDIAAGIRQEK